MHAGPGWPRMWGEVSTCLQGAGGSGGTRGERKFLRGGFVSDFLTASSQQQHAAPPASHTELCGLAKSSCAALMVRGHRTNPTETWGWLGCDAQDGEREGAEVPALAERG